MSRLRDAARGDVTRLVIVAALGAGIVLGFQAITGGGGGHASAPPSTVASHSAAAVAAAAGRPSGPAARAVRAGRAAPVALRRLPAAAAAPTHVTASALGRLPVTGAPLVVVFDRPSGPFAQQNRLILQGATVALDALNAAGGLAKRPARIVTEALDGLSTAAVAARLHAAGPAAVLVLPCDSDSQFNLAAAAAPTGTIMLAPCDADASLAARMPNYWPIGTAGNDEAAGLAGFMREDGYGRVFVLDTPGLRYTDLMTRYFTAAAPAKGIRIDGTATVSLALGSAEIARAAAAITALAPQPPTLFSALPPPYVDVLATALARAGVTGLLFGTSAMDTPLTLARAGGGLENATFSSYGFLPQTPAGTSFANAYRRRFGVAVGSFPGLGFETIGILEDAIAKARSTAPSAIGQAFDTGLDHAGVALADRAYKAGADHNPINDVSVEKISAGSFLPLVTRTPSDVPNP